MRLEFKKQPLPSSICKLPTLVITIKYNMLHKIIFKERVFRKTHCQAGVK